MGKKKYSDDLKLKIVLEYLDGKIGLNELAIKYHINSKADIQKWIAIYKYHGIKCL